MLRAVQRREALRELTGSGRRDGQRVPMTGAPGSTSCLYDIKHNSHACVLSRGRPSGHRHRQVIDMLPLSSDGDICASVSHQGATAPTSPSPWATPRPPLTPSSAPLSLSLSQSLYLSPTDSPSSIQTRRSAAEGSHRDEIEAGSCSSSPRVII